MLRPFLICALTLVAPCLAEDFSCPVETAPLEKKDEVQWMKACRDTEGRLHGPFEVWSRTAGAQASSAYRMTTKGHYQDGNQSGTWFYWNIEGVKVSEKVFP